MNPLPDVYAPPNPIVPAETVNTRAYASMWRRVAARLVDMVVVVTGIFIVQSFSSSHQALAVAAVPLQGFMFFFYALVLHWKSGQTLGKRLMNIRVVRGNGDAVDLARSARRSVIYGLQSAPWVVASMIALSQIPESQYLPLQVQYMRDLKLSLMPSWYEVVELLVSVLFIAELVSCFVTSRWQSLADLMADTIVVKVQS